MRRMTDAVVHVTTLEWKEIIFACYRIDFCHFAIAERALARSRGSNCCRKTLYDESGEAKKSISNGCASVHHVSQNDKGNSYNARDDWIRMPYGIVIDFVMNTFFSNNNSRANTSRNWFFFLFFVGRSFLVTREWLMRYEWTDDGEVWWWHLRERKRKILSFWRLKTWVTQRDKAERERVTVNTIVTELWRREGISTSTP